MIDEKKLIERLEALKDKCWNMAKKENNINFARKQLDISQIIGIIKNQPKISDWIPCSERLPGTRNNILICQRDGYVSVGYYSQEKFLDLNSYPFDDVVAWQPLPAPYEVKSDE